MRWLYYKLDSEGLDRVKSPISFARADICLNSSQSLLRISSNITDSAVIRTAPEADIRCRAVDRSSSRDDDTASVTTTTLFPSASRSRTVCWTHTCVSIPKTTKASFSSSTRCGNSGVIIEKQVLLYTVAPFTSMGADVLPSFSGYCSDTTTGIPNIRPACTR